MNFLTDNKRLLKKEKPNKYLDRLKQQYIAYVMAKSPSVIKTESKIYMGMRLFCLDCELVSFNDIEAMEFEVNQSVSS